MESRRDLGRKGKGSESGSPEVGNSWKERAGIHIFLVARDDGGGDDDDVDDRRLRERGLLIRPR